MTILYDYEQQVSDLLHDPLNQYFTLTQIDYYINEARKQLVIDTGGLRTLQTAYCTQGKENYVYGQLTGAQIVNGGSLYTAPTISFSGGGGTGAAANLGITNGVITSITFTSFGQNYTSAPSYLISDGTGSGAQLNIGAINVFTYDVIDIHWIWTNTRYSLQWMPFSQFSAYMRGWINVQRQPEMFTHFGHNQIYIGMPPDQVYPFELDSVILPTPFNVGDYVTTETIPTLIQSPIKFYAAYLAKNFAQSYGEAETLKKQYEEELQMVLSAYVRRVPNVYSGIRR